MSKLKKIGISLGFASLLLLVMTVVVWSQGGNFPPTGSGVSAIFNSVTTSILNVTNFTTGNVAIKPAANDNSYFVSVNGNDLNDGLSWGSAFKTISKGISMLGANGGIINIGCGTFGYATALSITTINTQLRGGGAGAEGTFAGCTILQPTAGVDGIDVGAQHVIIENLKIDSASTGAGSDIGIHACVGTPVINCNYLTIRDVTVNKTGSYGVYIDGTGGNLVNFWRTEHVTVSNTWSNSGMKWGGGTNQNGGISVNDVSQFNAGYGFDIGTNGTGTFSNTWIEPVVATNTTGGFHLGANSVDNTFINPYTEPGGGNTMLIDAGAVTNKIYLPFNNAPTVTDNADNTCSSALNLIYQYDGTNTAQGVFGFGIAPKPGATTPVEWTMHSGCAGTSAFDLTDTVNNNVAISCSHAATNPCTFSGGIIGSSVTQPTADTTTKIATDQFVQNVASGPAFAPNNVTVTNSVIISAPAQNTTKLASVYLTGPVSFLNSFGYSLSTADNTANVYDLGLYGPNCIGGATNVPLKAHTGPVAGTTFAPSTGVKTITLSGAPVTLGIPPGWYCMAITSSGAAPTAVISGDAAAVHILEFANGSSPGGATGNTSGGTLNATITAPTTTSSVSTNPWFWGF